MEIEEVAIEQVASERNGAGHRGFSLTCAELKRARAFAHVSTAIRYDIDSVSLLFFFKGTAMQRRQMLVVGLTLLALGNFALAADKPDPTGTWKWTVTRNDQTRDVTLKLKLEGDKLTGSMPGRNNQETKIDDAKFKDGEISFAVTREFNGQKFTTKYSGKLDGDTINGKQERQRDGNTQSSDWVAKREKPSA
jgi:hypothetical protein